MPANGSFASKTDIGRQTAVGRVLQFFQDQSIVAPGRESDSLKHTCVHLPCDVMPKGVGRQQRTSVHYDTVLHSHIFGVTATPRKTNYEFERRERERNKAADLPERLKLRPKRGAFEKRTLPVTQMIQTSDR